MIILNNPEVKVQITVENMKYLKLKLNDNENKHDTQLKPCLEGNL